MTNTRLAWGLLGSGRIAEKFAAELTQSRTGKLVAVASRSQASLAEAAGKFSGCKTYAGYDKLLEDPAVEAVYICPPHPFHAEWCVRAARAGKHILCEKPLTMNRAEAMTVIEAARENDVFLMEAFMYRCHPQTHKMLELIRGGAIGKVGVIHASFSYCAPYQAESRLFHPALGGGSILDVGCYPVSISRLIAGAAANLPFANPTHLHGEAVLHPDTGVDLYAVATARFPNGILAQLSAGVGLMQKHGVQIFGTEGSLNIPSPFVVASPGGKSTFYLTHNGRTKPEEITVPCEQPLYALEADAVSEAIARGERESAAMPLEDTLGNMTALDAWRSSVGVIYPGERNAAI